MDDLDEWYAIVRLGLYCGGGLYCLHLLTQNPTLFWTVLVANRAHTWYFK